MATHQIPIAGWSLKPDNTGRAYVFPYSQDASNDLFDPFVMRFIDPVTQIHGFYGSFVVPADYVGTAVIRIRWTAQVTSGNVRFDFDYRAVGGNDTESLDQATFQENLSVVDAAPSAINERMNVAISATSANFAAGDTVLFFFTRDGVNGTPDDTLAGTIQVFDLLFEYDDV